jgi:hypothetical protein
MPPILTGDHPLSGKDNIKAPDPVIVNSQLSDDGHQAAASETGERQK